MRRGNIHKKNVKKNICFKGDNTTLVDVFGEEPIDMFQLTKNLWSYIHTGIAPKGKM